MAQADAPQVAKRSLGRRITATVLLLLIGFTLVGLAVLLVGQTTVQTLVGDQLASSAATARTSRAAANAKVRDETLKQAEEGLHDKLAGMTGLIAGASASSMVTEDYGMVEDGCRNAVADPDAAWAFVTKTDGTGVAEALDPGQQADLKQAGLPVAAPGAERRAALAKLAATASGLMIVTTPILLDGKPAGMVTIVATLARLSSQRAAISARFATMETAADQDATQLQSGLRAAQDAAGTRLLLVLTASSLATLAIGMVLTLRLTRSIIRPLAAVGTVADGLAAGDLTRRATVATQDEVGSLAGALNTSMEHLQHAVRGIGGTAQALGGAAGQLGGISQELGTQAASSSSQAQNVAAGTRELSHALESVAAGVTELNSSVDEIARNAQQAADVGNEAVGITGETARTMGELTRASDEIRGIVGTIAKIASRTNLLALNATIEAASAGEAGRGFAVVANEVKELARQTAHATSDIGSKVTAIADGSAAASVAITRIAEIVERINQLQQAIASAVTEQAATTRELSGTVQQAAQNSSAIAASIAVVATAAEATTGGATRTSAQAAELARLAEELRLAVGRFRC